MRLFEIKRNKNKIFLHLMSFKSMFNTPKIRIACLIFLLSIHTIGQSAASTASSYKIKTIVLDAGHGGHDTGCNGPSGSYEKDVTLKIILLLGKLIEQKYPDIKVLYSRKTDVFIPLQDRALLANNNNADLFVSVHCNASANKGAYGSETFLMGLHVSQANLDVARRENAVIKLEDNYQHKYEGFDPDSPEAMIALSLAQNANIEQSSFLASKVQDHFTNKLNRFNRGVKQAGFWVLYRTTCPSILIETGFLTNKTEEQYLTSNEGQQDYAKAIFNAFEDYKNTVEKGSSRIIPPMIVNQETSTPSNDTQSTVSTPTNDNTQSQPNITTTTTTETENSKNGIVYKVQISVTSQLLPKSNKAFSISNNLKYEKVGNVYKYAYSPFADYNSASKVLTKAKDAGFKDAFIVVFKDGVRLSTSEARQYLQ